MLNTLPSNGRRNLEILDLMSELKLLSMRAAFDEVMANGVKRVRRQHS